MVQSVVLLAVLFLVLMIAGVPIAFSLSAAALVTAMATGEFGPADIVRQMIDQSGTRALLAIPFFVLAAKLMNTGGITRKIFRCCAAWFAWIPGGLGHANIAASIIFSGMSGSADADADGLGQIELDAMKEEGFDAEFSAAVTAASATIAPIIPPSIPILLYGIMTNVSVGTLFVAGVIPGLLMALSTGALVYFVGKKRNYPIHTFNSKEAVWSTKEVFPSLITPLIIVGGIWSDIFNPVEAACAASIYAFILAIVVYREADMEELYRDIREAVAESAGILLIVCGAAAFSWIVTRLGMSDALAHMLADLTDNKYVMLLILNAIFLVTGMFLEPLAALTITVPFLLPVIYKFAFNPVHMGVVLVLNLMIGLCTPPVGASLFSCAKSAKISNRKMYRAILPFLVPLVAVLFLITYVPVLVTWLPGLMG